MVGMGSFHVQRRYPNLPHGFGMLWKAGRKAKYQPSWKSLLLLPCMMSFCSQNWTTAVCSSLLLHLLNLIDFPGWSSWSVRTALKLPIASAPWTDFITSSDIITFVSRVIKSALSSWKGLPTSSNAAMASLTLEKIFSWMPDFVHDAGVS